MPGGGGEGQAQGLAHLGHGQEGVADTNAVDREGKEEGPDATQPGGGGAAGAQLSEGGISEHAAAAPRGSEHHRHGYMRHAETPPLPVPGKATHPNQTSHLKRCVHREGGGRHRGTG